MTYPIVTGIDLSLTSTGVARILPGGKAWAGIIRPPGGVKGYERMKHLGREILEHAAGSDLVTVEGPSYNSVKGQQGHHERAGLWWHVTYQLWIARIAFAVVPPASLKRYATGKGNANKDRVIAAVVRRYGHVELYSNDEADAFVLAAMGADQLGFPLAPVPQTHRVALTGVTWPQLAREES